MNNKGDYRYVYEVYGTQVLHGEERMVPFAARRSRDDAIDYIKNELTRANFPAHIRVVREEVSEVFETQPE